VFTSKEKAMSIPTTFRNSTTVSEQTDLAIYYEHPDWFRPLFAELNRRAIPYAKLDATTHSYDPAENEKPFAVLFNRMSPSAYLRGHGHGIFYTLQYLNHLERLGTRVINGEKAFAIEISKARQLALLESLKLAYPRARVINAPFRALAAAADLRFPIIVKANIGGSGAGIVRFDSRHKLAAAIENGKLDLGVDQTARVQEYIPPRGGHITRVETLGGKYLYAIKVFTTGDTFNLCPADICQTTDGVELARAACPIDAPRSGLRVEAFDPPLNVIRAVERIVQAAQIDVGGVEYIVDDRDGSLLYYDINALSNFVADATRVVGFDPHAKLVDFLEKEVTRCATVTGSRFSAVG
jgi:glutathione synthase/RimK-type ligase-like ATP-grasp enzyme